LEEALVDIFHELLLVCLLLVDVFGKTFFLLDKATLTHAEILNNQEQVLVYTCEVVNFLFHRVSLLLQFVQLLLAGTNVALQLLDLVIQHKLELLKLLSLFLQIVNSLILVPNGSVALSKLTLLALNVGF
jgi:hypothetical protein